MAKLVNDMSNYKVLQALYEKHPEMDPQTKSQLTQNIATIGLQDFKNRKVQYEQNKTAILQSKQYGGMARQ